MKDPRLHIKLSDLKLIIRSTGADKVWADNFADTVFDCANEKGLQIKNECVIQPKNKKTATSAARLLSAKSDNVPMFYAIFDRVYRDVKGISHPRIDRESKLYNVLREVTAMADEYTDNFLFSYKEEGYKFFIEVAIDVMDKKKFKLQNIRYNIINIHEATEQRQAIVLDQNKSGSKELYELWQHVGYNYSKSIMQVLKPEDFMHIVYGRIDAEENNASYVDWVTAQYEGLSFLKKVPELSQLYGPKAKERYMRYVSNKGIRTDNERSMYNSEYVDRSKEEYLKQLKKRRDERCV